MKPLLPIKQGSFRDPDGYCWSDGDRIFRYIWPHATSHFLDFHRSDFFRALEASNRISVTQVDSLAAKESQQKYCFDCAKIGGVYLEHKKIFFPSYAHEWCPSMLYEAGHFTLSLQLDALNSGYWLKDASISNLLFENSGPVFVDLLSFSKLNLAETVWLAQAQFIRNFVLPLLLYKYNKVDPRYVYFDRRDGLNPEYVFGRLNIFQKCFPSSLRFVTFPVLLGLLSKSKEATQTIPGSNLEEAKYIRNYLHKNLVRAYDSLAPRRIFESMWLSYAKNHSYDEESFAKKELFVYQALLELCPESVLDVGCNTGYFSRIAARLGAKVVGIDSDSPAIDEAWRLNRLEVSKILPLVVDFARPTPALGWRNGEQQSFTERSYKRFDCVLLLAVVHHLTLVEGVSFLAIFEVVSRCTVKGVIVEYIPPNDSMMKGLLTNREHLLPAISQDRFEEAFGHWFTVIRKSRLGNSLRWLYFLKLKS